MIEEIGSIILPVVEHAIALILAAVVVFYLSAALGDRAARSYRNTYDPEGNFAYAHSQALRQSVILATGITGAVKMPAILGGIAKIIAAVTGA